MLGKSRGTGIDKRGKMMEKDQKDRPLPEDLEKFWQERQRLNEVVMQEANLVMKRF